MTGPDPIFGALARDWNRAEHAAHTAEEHLGGWFRREPHGTQAPADKPVNVDTTTAKGEPMSLATDLRALADRVEPLGEEAAAKLEAVSANPATREILDILHGLTGFQIDPGVISLLGIGLKELLARAHAQQAAAPAG